MGRSIGVLATGHLWAGIVDGATLGTVKMYPEPGQPDIDLKSVPAPEIIAICAARSANWQRKAPSRAWARDFRG